MKTMMRWFHIAVVLFAVLGSFDTILGQTNAITVNPPNLTFTSPQGFIPATQNLTIGSTTAAIYFTISLTGSNCGYLAVSAPSGNASPTAPAVLQIAAQDGFASIGVYSCTLSVNASGLPSVAVPVTMNVVSGSGTSGSLSVSPATLSLSAQAGTTSVTSTLTLTNSSSTTVSYSVAVASTPSGWLTASPSSGTVPPNGSVQVQANPTGLTSGNYLGSITITPSGSAAITVPVTFAVATSPTLQIQQSGQSVSGVNFYYQNGTSLPAPQTLSFTSSTSAASIPFTLDVIGGSSFLVVSPTGSLTTPQSVSLSIASTVGSQNLLPGVYSGSVRVTAPTAANTSTTIPVNLTISNSALLTLVGSLPSAFNYQFGGTIPANQSLQIGTTSTALSLNVSTTLSSGQNWLTAGLNNSVASSVSPATLTIGVNPTGLAAGTYTANVTVSSPGISNTIIVPVTLNVSSSTLLGETPSQLSFTYQTGGAFPAAQTVTVTSSGGSLNFNVATATSSCGSNWLSVNQTSGSTGTAGAPITVSVSPSGITAPQICSGTVTLSSSGTASVLTVPVTLQVSANAIIQATPSALNLNGQVSTGVTSPVTLTLASSDTLTALTYTLTSPATWLYVSPTAGSTPVNVQVSANTSDASLRLGVNTTTLTLTSPSLQSPITIPVTLTLVSAANLAVSPTSLTFTQPLNGTTPAAQSLNISLTGTGVANAQFTATTSTSWLTVTPSSGSVAGQVSVAVNTSGLTQGTYQGSVVVAVAGVGQSPYTIPVTLTITAQQSLVVSATTLNFSTQQGVSVVPAAQTVQVTSSGNPITFTVGTTAANCTGFFSVSPTSGTTPANLTVSINTSGLPAGTCVGSITVASSGLPSQTIAVNLSVAASPTPVINTIVNGASFVPGAVAPGEIVTIYGVNIGPTTLANYVLTSNNTFSTKVSDTEVLFDSLPAPIIFVRSDQLAVVVPYEVNGRNTTNVQVRRLGQLSNIISQRVVDLAPGIFTVPSGGTGQGAIVNQNGVVNSAVSPATKGSVVSMYITGAGQTSPQGVSGALYGVSPLSTINADVSVTIGGLPAAVQYKGGAPYNIQGLYQVNVTIPQAVSINPVTVTMSVGGVPIQSGITMYVQ